MERYKKEGGIRIEVVNPENDDILFEITNRNWSNLGEVFNDHHFSTICNYEMQKLSYKPKKIMLVAVAEFELK